MTVLLVGHIVLMGDTSSPRHAYDGRVLDTFNSFVSDLPTPLIYTVIAALVFAEAALFFGFVLPGETAIIVGGVVASQGHISLTLLIVISVVAAVAGDSVGYEIGKKFGPRLLETGAVRKHASKVASAQAMIRRRGAFAVVIGRFTALLRALMPALAGSAGIPYRKFLFFNALGGIVWVLIFTLGGFYVGEAIERFAKIMGWAATGAVVAAVVIGFTLYSVRKHRAEHVEEPAGPLAAFAQEPKE
jgi:membrane-associated protein